MSELLSRYTQARTWRTGIETEPDACDRLRRKYRRQDLWCRISKAAALMVLGAAALKAAELLLQ